MRILPGLIFLILSLTAEANMETVNYDEARIPAYTLPDPLVTLSGDTIRDAEDWRGKRRPELLRLFSEQVYGKVPVGMPKTIVRVRSVRKDALDGLAVRKLVTLLFKNGKDSIDLNLLVYLPARAKGPVPVFLGYNFWGNHAVWPDAEIPLHKKWTRNKPEYGIFDHRANELSRGAASNRWPVLAILNRGFGVVTAYYGDLEADNADGYKSGLRSMLFDPGQTASRPDEWGAIGVWAWGLSRAMDYLATDPGVNSKKVTVIGHSRLGKAALWAGAQDERFSAVISNGSGCGGAALARRRYGETVRVINENFPYWFCGNYKAYGDRENEMPVDMHQLVALQAPRPVYVEAAEQDRWADPKGSFLSLKHAEPVYRLFGKAGLPSDTMPPINHPLNSTDLCFHVRSGVHELTYYDWAQYLDFAERHFGKGKTAGRGPL